MHILLGWAWTYLIVAEVVGTMSGITFFINQQARALGVRDCSLQRRNQKVQVEHCVTKEVMGVDLVEWMVRLGARDTGFWPEKPPVNAYAIGTVDFTGDMPIILGPDGPSLGGFVCPVTIRSDELWKVGQLRPGDKVRFVLTDARGDRQAQVPGSAILRQTLIILEAMKMEISVAAPCDGAVSTLTCKPGQVVMPGQRLAVIVRDP